MAFKNEEQEAPTAAPVDTTGYAVGSDYQPGGAVKKGIPVSANLHPDFRLFFHPLRWGWFQNADGTRGEWLPMLRSLPISPGIDNVDKDGDPSLAIGIASQGGWSVIEPSPLDPYITQHEARGGVAYLTRWTRVKVLGTTAFLSSDEDGYRGWLRDLCKRRGWKPDADVIALKRAEIAQELAVDDGDATNPKASARAKAARRMLDAIDGVTTKPKAAAKAKAATEEE